MAKILALDDVLAAGVLIKEEGPCGACVPRLPSIMLTGLPNADMARQAFALGAVAYFRQG